MPVEHSEQHYGHGIILDSGLNHQSWMPGVYSKATQPLSPEDFLSVGVSKTCYCSNVGQC